MRDGALAALVDVYDLLNGIRKEGETVMDAADYVATADGALSDLQYKLEHLASLAAEQLGPAAETTLNLDPDYKPEQVDKTTLIALSRSAGVQPATLPFARDEG